MTRRSHSFPARGHVLVFAFYRLHLVPLPPCPLVIFMLPAGRMRHMPFATTPAVIPPARPTLPVIRNKNVPMHNGRATRHDCMCPSSPPRRCQVERYADISDLFLGTLR